MDNANVQQAVQGQSKEQPAAYIYAADLGQTVTGNVMEISKHKCQVKR